MNGGTSSDHHPGHTASHLCRSVPLLAEARIHQLRRADRADRDHARGAGGKEALDQRGALSSRAELLHVAARTRGAAARNVCRLAAAQDVRWCGRGRALRHPVDVHPVGAELRLCDLRRGAVGCRDLLRLEACGARDRRCGRDSHRQQGAQERGDVVARRARLRGDLLFESAVSDHHPVSRGHRLDRREGAAR